MKPVKAPPKATALPFGADAIAIAGLTLVGLIVAATFRDYGLGWDDYTHSQYGDLLVSLYSSGFADKRALEFVNLYKYGGGFDLVAALAAKVSPFGLFATRRLMGGIVGLIGLYVTWRLGRRLGGPVAGLIAFLLLAACPLYYGHMFINAKDAPFATASAIALLGIVRAYQEYPRASPPTIALCGVGVGLAVGCRVLGGFAVLDAFLPLLFIVALKMKADGWRPALAECGRFLIPFVPGVILAYCVMGLVWPWSVVSPLNPFRAVRYFSHFFEEPWRELFDGHLILATEMPRSYVLTLLALKLPELMLALGLAGIAGALFAAGRNDRSGGFGRRAAFVAVLVAATLPVLITVITRPAMYNGVRHFVFILPPLAVLGGCAAVWIKERLHGLDPAALAAAMIALVAGIASPMVDIVRLHPFEYTSFNHLAGGVAGARPRYMLDYWGLSLTEAARQLRKVLAARHIAPETAPTLAVCGPHPPVNVVMGPQYTTTWNPKDAAFALTLGEFYCAELDAPLVFEIAREGVVYARVYDLRGRSVPTLLTLPGL